MSTRKSIVPEFMKNNPDDTFQFLFPLKIVLDEDKFGNSHYEVVVKNMYKNEYICIFGLLIPLNFAEFGEFHR